MQKKKMNHFLFKSIPITIELYIYHHSNHNQDYLFYFACLNLFIQTLYNCLYKKNENVR